jgi:hypothetical protein
LPHAIKARRARRYRRSSVPKHIVERVAAEPPHAQPAVMSEPTRPELELVGLTRVGELTTRQLELDAEHARAPSLRRT